MLPTLVRHESAPTAHTRRAAGRLVLLLTAIGPLSACGVTDALPSGPFDEWWSDDTAFNRASSLLLTLAQVNATILAFILGLGIVTIQLAARFAIPSLRVRRWDTLFLLVYAVVGVIVPLLWSLWPSAVGAAALTLVSLVFIVATPIRVARAARAGHPLELARRAVRDAQRRRLRARSDGRRLADAQHTLAAIRADTTPGDIRDRVQVHLQDLLLQALLSGHEREAADLVISVLGGLDDGTERRLEQFEPWLAHHGRTLCRSPETSQKAWSALEALCRRAADGQLELTVRAATLAATLAAGRLRNAYEEADFLGVPDALDVEDARVIDDDYSDVDHCLEEVQRLALLLSERVTGARRSRPLFVAVLTLLTDPSREIRLGDYVPLDKPFETAEQLYKRLSEQFGNDGPADEESRFRAAALIEVPLVLLEIAQARSCLDTSAGRTLLKGYLGWIDDAAERRSLWLVHLLVDALRRRIERTFILRGTYRSTTADRICLTRLLTAVAEQFATTAANLERRWAEIEGWGSGASAFFDVTGWGRDEDMFPLASRLLPTLDEQLWSRHPPGGGEHVGAFIDSLDPRRDVVRHWLGPHERPDVLLSVLLARWRRAIAEDYRRPGLAERRWAQREEELLQRADAERREALEELFARPVNPTAPEYAAESLAVLVRARRLLLASTETSATGGGIAARTYEGWRLAAKSWLEATEGDDEPDVAQLITGIKSLSTDAVRLSRDLRQPLQHDARSSVTRGLWHTVFGFVTPTERMLSGRRTAYRRQDLPQRTYCLLPESEGASHGFVAVLEDDRSFRLAVLENRDGSCEERVPFSRKYLPGIILQDCLGDLQKCTTCFGLDRGGSSDMLSCRGCRGTGELADMPLLREATHSYILSLPAAAAAPAPPRRSGLLGERQDWGGRVRVFTSAELRNHLADVLESLAEVRAQQNETAAEEIEGDAGIDGVAEIEGDPGIDGAVEEVRVKKSPE